MKLQLIALYVAMSKAVFYTEEKREKYIEEAGDITAPNGAGIAPGKRPGRPNNLNWRPRNGKQRPTSRRDICNEHSLQMLCAEASLPAMRRLIDIALDPLTDDRAAFVACKAVIEIAFGGPGDPIPLPDKVPNRPDLSKLSKAELSELKRLGSKIAPRTSSE